MALELRVPEGKSVRADRFLADHLPDLSRRRVQELLAEGAIRIDGRPVRKGEMLSGGTTLSVEIAPRRAELEPEAAPPLPILFEDASLIAVDKPAGRPANALRFEDRGTVANFLAARCPEARDASESPLDHGLVHRLDTATSGVLLAARNRDAWIALRRQFRERTVGKRYLALAEGALVEPGEINRPIEPDPGNARRVRVVASRTTAPRAREAVTRYRALTRYPTHTLLEVTITTGVMHQIRAHLAAIGHPVAGDSLYGTVPATTTARHWLHATTLEVTHPLTGRRFKIESPLPDDFAKRLRQLGPG